MTSPIANTEKEIALVLIGTANTQFNALPSALSRITHHVSRITLASMHAHQDTVLVNLDHMANGSLDIDRPQEAHRGLPQFIEVRRSQLLDQSPIVEGDTADNYLQPHGDLRQHRAEHQSGLDHGAAIREGVNGIHISI